MWTWRSPAWRTHETQARREPSFSLISQASRWIKARAGVGAPARAAGRVNLRSLSDRTQGSCGRSGKQSSLAAAGSPAASPSWSLWQRASAGAGRRPARAGGVAAAAGLVGHLLGRGGQQAGLPFALGGEDAGGAARAEVEHGPQLAEPVEEVQAQGVLLPARQQRGGDLPVAGPVDLIDPGAESAEGGVAFRPGDLPPSRRGDRLIGMVFLVAVLVLGEFGELTGERGDLGYRDRPARR